MDYTAEPFIVIKRDSSVTLVKMTTIVVMPRGKVKVLRKPLTFDIPQTLTWKCHLSMPIGRPIATSMTYRYRSSTR